MHHIPHAAGRRYVLSGVPHPVLMPPMHFFFTSARRSHLRSRTWRDRIRSVLAPIVAITTLLCNSGCRDSLGPDSKRSGVTLIYSGIVTDTIEAQIEQVITVEARADNGKLLPDFIIGFGALPAGTYPNERINEIPATVCAATGDPCALSGVAGSVVTDSKGRATFRIRLGNLVGKMLVVAQAIPLPNTDTLVFDV